MNLQDTQRFIGIIERAGVKLSKFEHKFLPSIKEQINKGYALTAKQTNVLLSIYQRVTEKNPNAI